jgi:hypothetical protein
MCDVFFFGTALRIDSQISETRLGMGMTIEGSRGAGHSRAPRGRKLLEGPAGRSEAEATARKDCRKPVEGAARSDIVVDMDCYFATQGVVASDNFNFSEFAERTITRADTTRQEDSILRSGSTRCHNKDKKRPWLSDFADDTQPYHHAMTISM